MIFKVYPAHVPGQPISFELLENLQLRYGVSITALASKWIDVAPQRAVLVAITHNRLLWARSKEGAYRSGTEFAPRRFVGQFRSPEGFDDMTSTPCIHLVSQ